MPPLKTVKMELEGNLGIQNAETLFSDLQEKTEETKSLQLDLSKVTGLDFAILQLFASLDKTLKDNKGKLVLKNVPTAIEDWFHLSDLETLLDKE